MLLLTFLFVSHNKKVKKRVQNKKDIFFSQERTLIRERISLDHPKIPNLGFMLKMFMDLETLKAHLSGFWSLY